jgi:hypothetical protein
MTFQSTVYPFQGAGVAGEYYDNRANNNASVFILDSVDAANNVFARVFTVTTEGVARAGGTGVFAGFMVNPKQHAAYGTIANGPLAPTMTLPNGVTAAMCYFGEIWVNLPAAADIGDIVLYDNTTGDLTTIAPGDTLPSGKTFAQAVVTQFTVTVAGLAVIRITNNPIPPAPPGP